MKTLFALIAAAIFAVGCATTAVHEPEPVLWPRPRSCQYPGGTLKLPLNRKLQIFCPRKLADSTAAKAMADLFQEIADVTPMEVDDPVVRACIWTQGVNPTSTVGIPPEGYDLWVSEEGMYLKGADAIGLLNGIRTLRQLVRLTDDAYEIPFMQIFDCPAFAVRGMHQMICDAYYSEGAFESAKQYLSVLGQLKYNVVVLQLDALPAYKSVKLKTAITQWPMEKLAALGAHAQAEGLEVIPLLQLGGHSGWFLRTPEHLKFWEKGGERKAEEITWDNSMLCPGQNDELLPILYGMIDELLEAFHPKRFHLAYDEIYLSDRLCPACVPQPFHIQEMYARQLNALADHLKERGVKAVMWGDRPLSIPMRKILDMDLDLATYPMVKWLHTNNLEIMNWYYGKNPDAFPSVVDYYHQNGFHDQSLAVMCFDHNAENGLRSALAAKVPALFNTLWYYSNGCMPMQFSVDSWNNLPYFADLAWNGTLPKSDGQTFRNRLELIRRVYDNAFPIKRIAKKHQRILYGDDSAAALTTMEGIVLRPAEAMSMEAGAHTWKINGTAAKVLAIFDIPPLDFGKVSFTERNFTYPSLCSIIWKYIDGTEETQPVYHEWHGGPASDSREYFHAETVQAADGTLHRVSILTNPHPEKPLNAIAFPPGRQGLTLSAMTAVRGK